MRDQRWVLDAVRKTVEFIRAWLTDKLDPRIKRLEEGQAAIRQDLAGIKADTVDVKRDMAVVNARLDGLDKRFDDMNERFNELAAMQRELISALLKRTDRSEDAA